MTLFHISCTTCRTRLKVADRAAIGQIVACPKCQSMVLVEPPAGWVEQPPPLPGEPVATTVVEASSAASYGARAAPPIASLAAGGKAWKGAPPLVEQSAASAAPIAKAPSHGAKKAAGVLLVGKLAEPAPTITSATTAAAKRAAWKEPAAEAAENAGRWFWPTLVGATALSLAAAGLLVYLNQPSSQTTTVAVNQQRSDDAGQHKSQQQPAKPVDAAGEKPTDVIKPVIVEKPKVDAPAPANVVGTASVPSTSPSAPPSPAPIPIQILPASPASKVEPVAETPPSDAPVLPADNAAMPPPANPAPVIRPTLNRVPPKDIDVAMRLADPLAGIKYQSTPLWRVLADLSQLSTVPITLDADALAQLGVAPDDRVSLEVKATTVSGVLDQLLVPKGLIYSVVEHQLLIGRPEQPALRSVRYGLADLAAKEIDQQRLRAMLQALVEPASWQERGGPAKSVWVDGALVVEQSDSAHVQILELCEKLRVARGIPLRSKLDPGRFGLGPRVAQADGLLATPVSASFARPEPLSRVVDHLRRASEAVILIDGVALAEQKLSVDTETLLTTDKAPLAQALTTLCEPLELTWRIIGPRAIEITTPAAASRRAEVAFYRASDLAPLGLAATADSLDASKLLGRLEPTADESTAIAIQFDPPSRDILFRAPQAVHARLQAHFSGAASR